MISGFETALAGGAGAVIVGAVGWAGTLLLKSVQQRASDGTRSVTDAASANAALLSTVKALQEENARLWAQNAAQAAKVAAMSRRVTDAEDQLRTALGELDAMRRELVAMRQQASP